MKYLNHIIKPTFIALFVATVALSFGQKPNSKLIVGAWKMIKTEDNGKEVNPKHEKLVIQFDKKGGYKVFAEFEETHAGTFKLAEDEKSVILTDERTKEESTLAIDDLDETHLALKGYDKENITIFMIPAGKKNHYSLTHHEALIAKQWHVFESDNEKNLGTLFEFKSNKTFIIIPDGSKIPVFTGKWKMTEDGNKIILDMREDGEHMELLIESKSRHELHLKNEESGVVNKFHDESLLEEDMKKLHPEQAAK